MPAWPTVGAAERREPSFGLKGLAYGLGLRLRLSVLTATSRSHRSARMRASCDRGYFQPARAAASRLEGSWRRARERSKASSQVMRPSNRASMGRPKRVRQS
jgi:hypothetical protein